MVIQHNLSAMNADRMNGIVNINSGKSAEKLSSGYRINRASDDAAGLAMSEKMRRQVRGLTQASINAQDGISMVQTAEGALNEVHDMLQRMNELCVKAANDTMTNDDRDYIQDEIRALTTEMDRVGAATTFNDIKLMDGLPQTKCSAVAATASVNSTPGRVIQTTDDDGNASYEINPLKIGDNVAIPGEDGTTMYYQVATKQLIDEYDKTWADYYARVETYEREKAAYEADPVGHLQPTAPASLTIPIHDGSSYSTGKLTEMDEIYDKLAANLASSNTAANTDVASGAVVSYSSSANDGLFSIRFFGPLEVKLQVGSEAEHTYSFKIPSVNSYFLGVNDVDVRGSDGSAARDGIGKVKEAMDRNSESRASLGAVQNRLEHIIKNLDNVVENTTAAESRIRDTDMASEMQYYSNTQIIAQAGQSLMAQANQSKQGVLTLLG